jgi:hypothetical protein
MKDGFSPLPQFYPTAPPELAPGPYRIWLSDVLYCVVSPEDFEWAKQWKWHATENSTGLKFYATRVTRERGTRKQIKIYLHKEILKRAGKIPPSPAHTIGDHYDGQSLNDRRSNLFWSTIKQNNTPHRYKHIMQWIARRYGDDAEYL